MKRLKKSLAAYKLLSTGAACFKKKEGGHFCAPKLTRAQAEEFADLNNMTLVKWQPGTSCIDFCPED
jgi:hypothetical protein